MSQQVTAADVDHWAVLVTGSKGYTNYRHHADVCHAYHIMRKNGIPEERIILMSYNDAVHAKENPLPGQLFNKPDGEDVYAGCKIDYEGDACNSHNFINVLKGNSSAIVGGNGKVLQSNENSKVFLYYVDHGAPGFVYFPDIENDKLYADVFNATIYAMYETKMYKELVIYMEACYSGSMFEGILQEDWNVYVMTAANAHEPSRATYCHPLDYVGDKHMKTCLGDVFSVTWMEQLMSTDSKTISLDQQFELVKANALKAHSSHVQKYGTPILGSQPVSNFIGISNLIAPQQSISFLEQIKRKFLGHEHEDDPNEGFPSYTTVDEDIERQHMSAISAHDVRLHHLYTVMKLEGGAKITLEVNQALTDRMRTDHVFKQFAPVQAARRPNPDGGPTGTLPKNFDCLRKIVRAYESQCGILREYALKYVKYFVDACENLPEHDPLADKVAQRIRDACEH